jgi:hypothetical protein
MQGKSGTRQEGKETGEWKFNAHEFEHLSRLSDGKPRKEIDDLDAQGAAERTIRRPRALCIRYTIQ